jgi:hypothetical protein
MDIIIDEDSDDEEDINASFIDYEDNQNDSYVEVTNDRPKYSVPGKTGIETILNLIFTYL